MHAYFIGIGKGIVVQIDKCYSPLVLWPCLVSIRFLSFILEFSPSESAGMLYLKVRMYSPILSNTKLCYCCHAVSYHIYR